MKTKAKKQVSYDWGELDQEKMVNPVADHDFEDELNRGLDEADAAMERKRSQYASITGQ